MKIYQLKRTQVLDLNPSEAWAFFSSPVNLMRITPESMGLKILHQSGSEKMYAGQIIQYHIRLFPLITLQWVTEITHVSEPHFFVDEQRVGPYALWHHQHHFNVVPGGIEVTDELTYALPLGILGRFAHWVFVEQKLKAIFDFRFSILEARFNSNRLQKTS